MGNVYRDKNKGNLFFAEKAVGGKRKVWHFSPLKRTTYGIKTLIEYGRKEISLITVFKTPRDLEKFVRGISKLRNNKIAKIIEQIGLYGSSRNISIPSKNKVDLEDIHKMRTKKTLKL